ncbi:hypothetical protein [Sphingobium yanoikuyae]|uniref:hypothetical protein n=1 Tax=Sphingobium yanoikuyae TaxID=13690 RepID=UPI0035C75942
MSIEVTISQRCGGEYGQPVYFAADCTATFSLDGNADNAQLMAGGAVENAIKAHRGDTLLIVVKLNGEIRARWMGEATDIAAQGFDDFISSGRLCDFAYTARWIKMREEAQRRAAEKADIEVEIDDSTQSAPVRHKGRVIATVQRRRVIALDGEPYWKVYLPCGTLLFATHLRSQRTLRRRLQNFADGTGMFTDSPLSPANKGA